MIFSLMRWHEPRAACLLAGGMLYLVGALGVTIAFDVPRNEALAAVVPTAADSASLWIRYVSAWTAWNHVRAAAALGAAACFAIALGL